MNCPVRSNMPGICRISSHEAWTRGKRSASVPKVVSYTKVFRCPQTKKSNALRSGDRAGHAMTPHIDVLPYQLRGCNWQRKRFWTHVYMNNSTSCYVEHPTQFCQYNFKTFCNTKISQPRHAFHRSVSHPSSKTKQMLKYFFDNFDTRSLFFSICLFKTQNNLFQNMTTVYFRFEAIHQQARF